ncbi:glycosyl hydrolase [Paenibacillus wulumuqiensis]|uniref:glycosyl hydrolase n=1 Tax=Paenibacillus wulumuqiensis TaxID=1567107 RepID=UPI00069793B1|nr:glycosyl hydrolase [Paenibacillus wulumuqiensis]
MSNLRHCTIGILTAMLALTPALSAMAQSASTPASSMITESSNARKPTVDLADRNATRSTRSLFAYLDQLQGKEIIFGHQHATTEGIGITAHDGSQSEVQRSVGDLPGMFGWDTLSLEGKEKPGIYGGTAEQSRDELVRVMKQAYEQGGVLALSSHMPNFVTGNDFYDTKGNVISHILPGGDKHAEYNAFLDKIADFALHLKDDRGEEIPVIFRPFHEQSGGWFWWGAPYRTKEQYIEIYRYTVEYLRDVKGVHNFLYAYSPNVPFNDSRETYLETYPGDEYVDILGLDAYYDGNTPTWYDSVVRDARLVVQLAEEKHKVPALTEFGYSNVKPTGTKDLQFYTRLLSAIKNDPEASKLTYMLTWANFGTDSIFVPYRDAPNGLGDHELLPDFTAFYDDDYTSFDREVQAGQPYALRVKTAAEQPFLHIVSPTNQETVRLSTPSTLRVRIVEAKIDRVTYQTRTDPAEHKLTRDRNGLYYTANWQPDASLAEDGTPLTVKAYLKNGKVLTQTIQVYVSDNDGTTDPLVVDTFEHYKGSNELLDNAYTPAGDANRISLDAEQKQDGRYGLKYEYMLAAQGYTGESLNMQGADWSGADALQFWLKPDGSGNKLVIQVNAGGTSFEAYPSLNGTEAGVVKIPFSAFKPAPWDTANAGKTMDGDALRDIRMFSIYVNKGDGVEVPEGTLYFDDIRAYREEVAAVE